MLFDALRDCYTAAGDAIGTRGRFRLGVRKVTRIRRSTRWQRRLPQALSTRPTSAAAVRCSIIRTKRVLADLERIAARGYQRLGNWSLGQIAKHQAVAMTTAVDGFPGRVAWPIRAFAQLFIKRKVLNEPMRAGVKLPAKFAKVLVPDTTGDAEGIEALRTATHRLQTEPQRHPTAFSASSHPPNGTSCCSTTRPCT